MSEPFQIVDLSPDDEDAVEQIASLLLSAFTTWHTSREEARNEVRDSFAPGHTSLVARSGDRILGWIGAIPVYDYAWELHPLVVHQETRGMGVGSALVSSLEARARERGMLTVYLGTDDDGDTAGTSVWGIDLFPDPLMHAAALEVFDHPVGFYRRHGYVIVGLVPDANGPGRPDILMAKRIGHKT